MKMKNIKINWKLVGKAALIIIGAAGSVYLKWNNIDVNTSNNYTYDGNRILYIPSNPEEAAIQALVKTGKNTWSDSSKLKVANDIFKIASKKDISDAAKAFAITGLSTVADSMWSDSSKQAVSALISQIGEI